MDPFLTFIIVLFLGILLIWGICLVTDYQERRKKPKSFEEHDLPPQKMTVVSKKPPQCCVSHDITPLTHPHITPRVNAIAGRPVTKKGTKNRVQPVKPVAQETSSSAKDGDFVEGMVLGALLRNAVDTPTSNQCSPDFNGSGGTFGGAGADGSWRDSNDSRTPDSGNPSGSDSYTSSDSGGSDFSGGGSGSD